MQEIAPAEKSPTTEQLIELCGAKLISVMNDESSEGTNSDRIFLLRQCFKAEIYTRNLQNYAPEFYASLLDASNVVSNIPDDGGVGRFDYSQNIYAGYLRKLMAVLGNRMPNAAAIPNNTSDPSAMSSVDSADHAALYIREHCNLQLQSLYLVYGLFNFGTNFWHLDFVIDGEKYGYKPQEVLDEQPGKLGNASFVCPQCAQGHPAEGEDPQPPAQCQGCNAPLDQSSYQPAAPVNLPKTTIQQVPKGSLEISLHNATEITVPLDSTNIDDCPWLDYQRETHKAKVLAKWKQPDGSNPLRDALKSKDGMTDVGGSGDQYDQYAQNVRASFASPIGLVRPRRENYWTERDTWWTPAMYEMIEDQAIRNALQENFPTGLRIISVKGKIIDLREEKLQAHWQECKPLPSMRVMAQPLGNDWFETQDLVNNILNQRNEVIERSNLPFFYDPTKIDSDAWETRRDLPMEGFPVMRPAGGQLQDVIYQLPAPQYSEQMTPFSQEMQGQAENISGILPAIWGGGDAEEPTARQAELKKNAALMQLGVIWTMIGKSLEQVYMKGCQILAEYEDGVLAFTQKDEFQEYQTLAITIADLRGGEDGPNYHFECDEAVPLTWGQQRDLLMWMLDKPAPLLELWGMSDPYNIFEFKQLLGMPGQNIPLLNNLKKGMYILKQLLQDKPSPGQIDPATGQPGPKQPSILPDWDDDPKFSSALAMAYLQKNFKIKETNPDGVENVTLWGQAQQAKMNAPAPPPPPKASVAVALKGQDLGNPAVEDMVEKLGLVDKGTQVGAVPAPAKLMPVPSTPEQTFAEKQDNFIKTQKAARDAALPPGTPIQ